MTYYYQYQGTIGESENGCRRIVLDDVRSYDRPPCALQVPCRAMQGYLENRSWTDDEERYLTQIWIYDRNLFLQAVVIPGDREGIPAKVIACADPDRFSDEMVIFGPSPLLNEEEPKSMDADAFHEWIRFRNRFGLRPRNGGAA